MISDGETGLWARSLAERAQTAPLEDDLTADLVIVGGGFTGCAAALEAARMGASVVVLEAKTIGHGGSGRNVGLVNAGLWLPPETIREQMGDAAGQRLIDALSTGPDRVFELIEREAISCEATRNGTLHLAHAPSAMNELKDRHRQGNASGAALTLLDAQEARRRTGSNAFHGALWNPRAGTIQPLAYCHGLARAAMRGGARIFTATPANRIERQGEGWCVRTPAGTVRAGALLMATNAYGEAAAKPRRPQYTTVNFTQFATAPLPQGVLDHVLPGREGCWDTATIMSAIRLDAAGRLIIGCIGNGRGPGGWIHGRWARRKLGAIYPALADTAFEHEWTGRIAMTRDHVPKIVSPGRSALSIFGYSGRGIAPGTIFGTAAARALLQGDMESLPMPVSDGYREGLTTSRELFFEAGAAAIHIIDARAPR